MAIRQIYLCVLCRRSVLLSRFTLFEDQKFLYKENLYIAYFVFSTDCYCNYGWPTDDNYSVYTVGHCISRD